MSIPTITEQSPPIELQKLVGMLSAYSKANLVSRRQILTALIAAHGFISYDWGGEWEYKRARKISTNDSMSEVNDVLWPPAHLVAQGRANVSGMDRPALTRHLRVIIYGNRGDEDEWQEIHGRIQD